LTTAITKALVPIQSLVPSITRIDSTGITLDLYPDRSHEGVIFTVFTGDELDGIYGPDGKRVINQKTVEFIDTYV
jgi:hypothetical protein